MQKHQKTFIALGLVVSTLILSVVLMQVLNMVPALGRHIPSVNVAGEYVDAIVWALAFTLLVIVLPFPRKVHKTIVLLWVVKSAVTLVAMLYYEFAYDLDAYWYYSTALRPDMPYSFAFGEGTRNVSWLLWHINKLLPLMDSYHALKLIWSFLGFTGVCLVYLGYSKYVGRYSNKVLWAIGLFPTTLFWSSVLNKDPIVFFGICLFFYGAFTSFKRVTVMSSICILLGVGIAASIRMWLGGILLAPYFLVFVLTKSKNKFVKFGTVALVMFSLIQGITMLQVQMNLSSKADVVNRINTFSRAWDNGGSGQEVPEFNSLADMVAFAPVGMFTAMFRPLPGEINNMFGILAGLENLVLLILFINGILLFNSKSFQDPFVVFCILILGTWSFFYGFVSYQNLGTAVRFKLQIVPLAILLPLYLLHKRKINQQLARRKPPKIDL